MDIMIKERSKGTKFMITAFHAIIIHSISIILLQNFGPGFSHQYNEQGHKNIHKSLYLSYYWSNLLKRVANVTWLIICLFVGLFLLISIWGTDSVASFYVVSLQPRQSKNGSEGESDGHSCLGYMQNQIHRLFRKKRMVTNWMGAVMRRY